MFSINLYNFSKKVNSTKIPNTTPSSFSCVLKENSGIVNPTIILDIGLSDSPAQFNYAYIPEFNRYYWIEEWTNEHPRWIASLKVDVLATYKNEIGDTPMYILRSASNYDGNIIDTLYPTKVSESLSITDPSTALWNSVLSNGCFVIGVISDGGAFGGIDYYALTYSNMNTLIHSLLNDQIADGVNGFSAQDCQIALQKALIDPLSYIKSCIYIPYDDVIGTPESVLRIWSWNITVPCKKISLNNTYTIKNATIDIPKHPQTSSRGAYANANPFTQHILSSGIFGDIPLDSIDLIDASSISLNLQVDVTNGEGILSIYKGLYLLNRIKSAVGVPIQLSQVSRSAEGYVMSGLSNILTGVDALAPVTAGLTSYFLGGGVGDGARSVMPRASSIGGGSGGFSIFSYPIKLLTRFLTLVDDDITSNGRPLCQVKKPNTLSGYMIIQDADVSLDSTSTELAEVRSYLEGGFYYE